MAVESENLGKLVAILYRQSVIYYNRRLKSLGITAGDMAFLIYLRDHPGFAQEDMAEAMGLNKSTVTRGLRHLAGRGLIRREGDQLDRRKRHVFLSEAGWDLMPQLERCALDWDLLLSRHMAGGSLEEVKKLLAHMVSNTTKGAGASYKHGKFEEE